MAKVAAPPSLNALLDLSCRVKVVDVGANPLEDVPPYLPMLRNGHATVIGFEPNPEALQRLNAAKGAAELYFPYAVGDGSRRTINFCAAQSMTSLLKPNMELLSLLPRFAEWSRVVATAEIETVRLDDVPETDGMDMLKIDIQGGELMVFENAVDRLRNGLVVHTEVLFVAMYHDQPTYTDLDLCLRQLGYVLHRFEPLISRTVGPLDVGRPYEGMGQLIWADAIFVRDFMKLDQLTDEQLLRFAVILHDCYRSYDLVLLLLAEHDRRCGSRHGARYISWSDARAIRPQARSRLTGNSPS